MTADLSKTISGLMDGLNATEPGFFELSEHQVLENQILVIGALHSGPTLSFAFLFARSDIKPAIKLPKAGVTIGLELSFYHYNFSCLTKPIFLVF